MPEMLSANPVSIATPRQVNRPGRSTETACCCGDRECEVEDTGGPFDGHIDRPANGSRQSAAGRRRRRDEPVKAERNRGGADATLNVKDPGPHSGSDGCVELLGKEGALEPNGRGPGERTGDLQVQRLTEGPMYGRPDALALILEAAPVQIGELPPTAAFTRRPGAAGLSHRRSPARQHEQHRQRRYEPDPNCTTARALCVPHVASQPSTRTPCVQSSQRTQCHREHELINASDLEYRR